MKSKNTTPEMVVRRLVHSLVYRYRLHVTSLPGAPDLVFPSRRKVVFIHGCYWHRHNCKGGRSMPSSKVAYWTKKLAGNKARDARHRRKLRRLGWEVMTVWECQTKRADAELLRRRLVEFLG